MGADEVGRNKYMNREEVKALTKEMLPIINQLSEVIKKHISQDKNCSVLVKGDGYFHIMIDGVGFTVSRERSGKNIVFIP